MELLLVRPPKGHVVTLQEVKDALGIPWSSEDAALAQSIVAATDYAETYQGRAYLPQTWRLTVGEVDGPIKLYRLPIVSVTEVRIGDELVEHYELRGRYLHGIHRGPVTVTYEAGTGEVSPTVPQAILLMVGHWYLHREAAIVGTSAAKVPLTAEALLDLDRVVPV